MLLALPKIHCDVPHRCIATLQYDLSRCYIQSHINLITLHHQTCRARSGTRNRFYPCFSSRARAQAFHHPPIIIPSPECGNGVSPTLTRLLGYPGSSEWIAIFKNLRINLRLMNPNPEIPHFKTPAVKKKVAIFYPNFGGGGAESVCLWMLEALKNKYDLTLFTLSGIDLTQLNTMYGTQLSPDSVQVKALLNQQLRGLTEFARANNASFRMIFFHLLIGFFKKHCDDYDLMISAYNATDLGKRGIQYIHWTGVLDEVDFYKRISNFSDQQMKSNISLVNSIFVAERFKHLYGVDSTVVYPPVVAEFPEIPWETKENAFICSGRLTKPKEPHKVIEILSQVRQQGFDIKLYLTGGGGGAYAWGYQKFLKQKIAENSDWVTLYQGLPYQDYVKILSKCKYGIHFKQEPFGISIAEMVKAGCIPFVKSKGGQVEIVGSENEALFFKKPQEAVEKIVAVLSQPAQTAQLRQSLAKQKHLFSTDRFMAEIDREVEAYFAQH
ncbi:MAG: hypothetical protein RLZZ435_1577 [Cyanobacteriota bacterium]